MRKEGFTQRGGLRSWRGGMVKAMGRMVLEAAARRQRKVETER
jgi:hypothetical protein